MPDKFYLKDPKKPSQRKCCFLKECFCSASAAHPKHKKGRHLEKWFGPNFEALCIIFDGEHSGHTASQRIGTDFLLSVWGCTLLEKFWRISLYETDDAILQSSMWRKV